MFAHNTQNCEREKLPVIKKFPATSPLSFLSTDEVFFGRINVRMCQHLRHVIFKDLMAHKDTSAWILTTASRPVFTQFALDTLIPSGAITMPTGKITTPFCALMKFEFPLFRRRPFAFLLVEASFRFKVNTAVSGEKSSIAPETFRINS